MSDNLQRGDRGRVVMPADIRERLSSLLGDRAGLEHHVRRQLAGRDLVTELLDERRAAAAAEG